MKKNLFKLLILSLISISVSLSQDCANGFTFFPEIPNNVTNINNEDNCFFTDDIAAINDLINLNSMSYDSPLAIGIQTWVSNRLVSWVATYTPTGSNGVNEKISFLPESIGNLTNLESLYLEWNSIMELPNSFSNLTSMKNLAISNNYLSSLPDIGSLINLTYLDLGYNQMTMLPESIENLQNLEYLYIFNNQLQSLPESICNLNLTWSGVDPSNYPYFASGDNQLCDSSLIPDCVESSSNFEISLDQFYYSFLEDTPHCCCAYFSEIPNNVTTINNDNGCFNSCDIATLNDLITDSSPYNSPLEIGIQTWVSNRLVSWVATYTPTGSNGVNEKISSLPSSIDNLTNLESLYLEWNDLQELPNSFSSLTSLKNLAISNNYLSSLPYIGSLINLTYLDLGYNQITMLPTSIGNLQNLEYLYIFNNQLQSLPESICNLNLTWSGVDPSNYPYFASGDNQLCDSSLIPDCVESSSNFEISLDQFYYSFLEDTPQNCSEECILGDMNADAGWNVLDIVALANCVLASNCGDLENGCAGDMNGDGGWNVLDIVGLANCVLASNCG